VDYFDISRKSLVPNMDTYDHCCAGWATRPSQSLRDRMMAVASTE